jgi:hypothetical protein
MTGKRPNYLDGVYDAESLTPKVAGAVTEDDDLGYCSSRPVAKLYHALGVKRNGKRDRVFEYSHFATSYEGDNERLDLVFAGQEKWVVVVHGVRLLHLLYFIKERRIDWIKEAHRDMGQDDGKPFISRIEVHQVVEEGK